MTCLAQLPQGVDRNRIHVLGCLNHLKMVHLLRCSAAHLALSYPYTLSWSYLEAWPAAHMITSHEITSTGAKPEVRNHRRVQRPA